jgi:DNA-binding winged helix-turn-helix (wHTH) protein
VPFHFEGYSVDVDRRELRRGAELIDIGPQVFDLLVYLIRNRDRMVSKDDLLDAVWEGRIVSESTLSSRINAARYAVGDTGADQMLIKTIPRKGFRFIGEVEERNKSLPQASAGAAEVVAGKLRQEIQFCTASDGVRIAYAAVGKGPPLVKAANWLNHLEYDWQSPIQYSLPPKIFAAKVAIGLTLKTINKTRAPHPRQYKHRGNPLTAGQAWL